MVKIDPELLSVDREMPSESAPLCGEMEFDRAALLRYRRASDRHGARSGGRHDRECEHQQ
jgi:hypothetical protein